jgi:hypothetical protein
MLIAVVLAITFGLIASEVFQVASQLQKQKFPIAIALAGAGFLVLSMGGAASRKNEDTEHFRISLKEPEPAPSKLISVQFCGVLFLLFGAMIAGITQVQGAFAKLPLRTTILASESLFNPQAASAKESRFGAKKPGARQPLKLQGIFYRNPNPAAIVNGQQIFVGDHVGQAKVLAIDRERVTFELPGEPDRVILKL